ncbi:hypothetical protein [Collimonas fungivorans]|uniref:Uncharacterized protein n=1 Tax=Collimonas fungivorans (strain Ter331) TaxID=1005048 RepID=G0AH97_COLFT|nr:hypothetical protein [Collimonas fungivorans]AEK62503.1 hypothetical protein CFU_2676 [Collimonas fungivorans Ter331]
MLISAKRKTIAQLAADLCDKKAAHEMLSMQGWPNAEIAAARVEYNAAREALEQAMPGTELSANRPHRL